MTLQKQFQESDITFDTEYWQILNGTFASTFKNVF